MAKIPMEKFSGYVEVGHTTGSKTPAQKCAELYTYYQTLTAAEKMTCFIYADDDAGNVFRLMQTKRALFVTDVVGTGVYITSINLSTSKQYQFGSQSNYSTPIDISSASPDANVWYLYKRVS